MKITKKLISILLVICIISVPVASVFASAEEAIEERKYPTIWVPGFMASDLYAESGNNESEEIWPVSAEYILGYVAKILPALAKFSITWDWNKFAEESTPILNEMFSIWGLDKNGEASDGSGAAMIYPDPETITENSEISFRYDWRLDPITIAAQLNDFIEYVCMCSGCDKVCISCHSLGGVMTLSYITLYGDSRIQSLVMNSTAVYGETYTGELLTGQIKIDGNALSEFFQYLLDGNEYEELLDGILIMLDDFKLTDFIAEFGNLIIEKMGDILIPEVVVPIFAYWPSIWAMVPDDYVDDAIDYVFNNVMADNGVDYTSLRSKIDNFNVIRNNRVSTLNKINNDCNLYIVARYGYCSIPITPSWDSNSDGVIDTKNTSYGATVTKYGTVFADNYITENNKEYISPDHTVDASTCLFPDQTWFIRGMAHAATPDCLDEFMLTLMHYDGQATVDTFKEYPRFMVFDHDNETLTTDTTQPAEDQNKILRIFNRIKAIFNMFKELCISSISNFIKDKVKSYECN